jgi:four helix bundle protein
MPRAKYQDPRTNGKRAKKKGPRTKMEEKNEYEVIEIQPMKYQIREAGSRYAIDLKERTFEFAVAIIELLKTIPCSKENDVIRYQLAKSGTSVGANYEESQATNSRADFRHKISIALREVRESNYWLRIIKRIKIGDQEKVLALVEESYELRNIFGDIYNKVSD